VASTPHAVEDTSDRKRPAPGVGRLARRWAVVRATGEAGMSTAEYAVGTIATAAFGMVLYQVLTSEVVTDALQGLVGRALDAEP
jgi:hypothetical protein